MQNPDGSFSRFAVHHHSVDPMTIAVESLFDSFSDAEEHWRKRGLKKQQAMDEDDAESTSFHDELTNEQVEVPEHRRGWFITEITARPAARVDTVITPTIHRL